MLKRVNILITCVVLLTTLMYAPAPVATAATMGTTSSETQSVSGPLSGAIFTTTVDGDIVNENVHYEAKEDVYLDGGPGPNAPAGAAGLPAGDYYFQVTDPSGKDLLSEDHISCRQIRVNDNGVIEFVYEGTNYVKSKGNWVGVSCQHNQGVDIDHSELGAITVQLVPYADTPNNGGVYKVWITPVDRYTNPGYVPVAMNDPVNGENWQPGDVHGFEPRWSKTDNYKVEKKGKPFNPPVITVAKFHDKNLNGIQDEGEESVQGWAVDVTDPIGVTNTYYTPALITAAVEGAYTLVEETLEGTLQTVSTLDGAVVSSYPTADPTVVVDIAGLSDETHHVEYGNVGLGSVSACKYYDVNANGVVDEGEVGIEGWMMKLTGTTVLGDDIGPIIQFTGEDGCTSFSDLLPGIYNVSEVMPSNEGWVATSPEFEIVEIESSLDGSDIAGTALTVSFTNYFVSSADFGTKGYWHNKNGLAELTTDDIDYVNMLDVYDDPTSYFQNGDEKFDGLFADGTWVDAAFSTDDGSMIWAAGTWQSEVSHFLVDPNAGGDPREQLAQQLLAFIFNVQHRLDSFDAMIWDGSQWLNAGDLIDQAIAAWQGTDATLQNSIKTLLDWFNNQDNLMFISGSPGPIVYP